MHTEEEREQLRQTFDQAAERYDRVRPEYPEALFDDLVALTGLHPGDHLIEVGCATGKATRPLARRGFRITCVELGAELAAVARQNLAGFEVEIVRGQFEEWQPGRSRPAWCTRPRPGTGSIPPSATSGPGRRCSPGGHLAFWEASHVFPDGGDPFFDEIDDIYDEIGEADPPGTAKPRPGELPDDRAGIEASGLFEVTAVRQYDWERVYFGRGVHRAAQHVLRAHRHGGVEAPAAVRRGQAAAGAAQGPLAAAALGSGAAGRPAARKS